MNKTMGATILVAGTCIGSGMIALPMVLAKLGIIPSLVLMLVIWYIMYYSSLVNLELNLQAKQGLPLSALGKLFSGRVAELIGTISLKLLSYSLLAVFIYGGTSIIQTLIASKVGSEIEFTSIALVYALVAGVLLLLPIRVIDHINRLLFMALIAIVGVLIVGLVLVINWSDLPLFSENYQDAKSWIALIPVVFTSFGFQVIFHTLTNYCKGDASVLKRAFFWGSLIPALIYMLWTSSILSVVYHDHPEFYKEMAAGSADVGALVGVLSSVAKWQSIQMMVWWISLLAIATSVLGVGVGLCDAIKGMLSRSVSSKWLRSMLGAILTVLPAFLVVVYVPNAFIAVLGFAGMILAVIAILLPIYLLSKVVGDKLHYAELGRKWLLWLSVAVGIIVILCECFNIWIKS